METRKKESFLGRMTSKGQTTIPKEVRDLLGLSEGAQVEWIVEDGKAMVKPRTRRAIDLAGFLGEPPNGRHVSIEEMDDAAAEAAAERFKRATRR
ncbi:AbrB/MazE/SpoVT family DNA-binding domain-containing protein [Devosia faecipullorum]|uniref:AbrB/MazE/SpoVT family DNA-binding domain-containing protein n=1 Tax=Devosia faecipullorum TaxID=2755039 RepID=UPI00187BA08E|nr:AbrB/MazE/SpoVT family DNA-binding domain-containing protein [Devosia faecipullorum]MBE7733238.1 AbrB/MazE/SpoVT family DNA-binding domain-containing protein [Devosia faecipullorum]